MSMHAQRNGKSNPGIGSYSPAFYSSGGAGLNEQKLQVFPMSGKDFNIPLPVSLGRFTYAPDGEALYAETASKKKDRFIKFEFNPLRGTPVKGAEGMTSVHSIAVSGRGDKLLFSGHYQPGEDQGCGIFELNLATHRVRKVIDNPDCDYRGAWLSLSLAPEGLRAVAVRKNRVELIDLTLGTLNVLGGGFMEATWSPDGRWIAALENGVRNQATLFDTDHFSVRRTLETSGVRWSPDSLHLLGLTGGGCGTYSYYGTLQVVNVASGQKTLIMSSKCKVNQATGGWVNVHAPSE